MYLPDSKTNLTLREAIGAFFDTVGAKHQEGAIGLLTQGVLGRAELYEQGVIAALIPFLRPGLYSDSRP